MSRESVGIVPIIAVSCAVAVLGSSCSRKVQKEVTLESCLRDMTNVATFARTPLGKPGMVSTYDRSGGNNDWRMIKGLGDDGIAVIAELKGPGCIKRIWKTSSEKEWLFFFDGESSPSLTLTPKDLFGGKVPFTLPLCGKVSGGSYCYLPMPFEKSVKIAFRVPKDKEGPYFYHQINYETYPAGTRVKTFSPRLSGSENALLEKVRRVWLANESELIETRDNCTEVKEFVLKPGASLKWLDYLGKGSLNGMWFRIRNELGISPLSQSRQLRDLGLRMFWDGSSSASVDVPLGDFFCNGLYPRTFSAMPLGLVGDTYICRFPMPFSTQARAELTNNGNTPVKIDIGYHIGSYPENANERNFFHANWNWSVTSGAPLGMLYTKGKGHFVGCYLISLGADGTWNNLEADESFYVDNMQRPALHGTGLEDYFNGAWYYYGLFDLPTHGLLEKAAMRTAQYRFHISDPIRFEKSMGLTFEFGDGNRSRGYMSGVSYWYQSAPVAAGSKRTASTSRHPALDRFSEATAMAGLFEFERADRLADARFRSMVIAAQLGQTISGFMFQLRAAAYTQALDGWNAAAPLYRQFVEKLPNTPCAAQASALLNLHASNTNALLTAHGNGKYVVYLDGQEIFRTDDPTALEWKSINLTPGTHVVVAKVGWIRSYQWFDLKLRTEAGSVLSLNSWKVAGTQQKGWLNKDFDDSDWAVAKIAGKIPKIPFFTFKPNAFILTQHDKGLAAPGLDDVGQTTYYRQRFEFYPNKQQ